MLKQRDSWTMTHYITIWLQWNWETRRKIAIHRKWHDLQLWTMLKISKIRTHKGIDTQCLQDQECRLLWIEFSMSIYALSLKHGVLHSYTSKSSIGEKCQSTKVKCPMISVIEISRMIDRKYLKINHCNIKASKITIYWPTSLQHWHTS